MQASSSSARPGQFGPARTLPTPASSRGSRHESVPPTHRPHASLPNYPANPSDIARSTTSLSSASSIERPRQAVVHVYNAVAGTSEVQFFITLEASNARTDEYEVTLTYKAGDIERGLGDREILCLNVDPTLIKFDIFLFPKPSLPIGCLFCVRVWLDGVDAVQHRIFSCDDLWIGRDPPFHTIERIALTQLSPSPPVVTESYLKRTYRGFVGRAACEFTMTLILINPYDRVYGVSMEYAAGGVRRKAFDDIKLRIYCKLDEIRFVIYTVPLDSSIAYSNHRIRVWIRGTNRIHHRLWKSDDFRLGANLEFHTLARGNGSVVFAARDPHSPMTGYRSSLLPTKETKSAKSPTSPRPEDFPPTYTASVGII